MSYPQITAAYYEFGELNMTSTPYTGSIFTHSYDNKVTDSAAGATALAAGYKTKNGMLAQLPDGTPVKTIAHYAAEIGKSTALMATSRITHATPAGFGVHHHDRSEEFVIAEKYVDSGIDMLLGAGYQYFLPEHKSGIRPDGRNLIAEMEQMGYIFIDDVNDLHLISGQNQVIALLERDNLRRYPTRGDVSIQLIRAALDQLSQNPAGFFMMIEGAMIDWGGHANNIGYVLNEILDFDNVIGEVLEFAKNDGNTLVLITADHETGGLTMNSGEDGEIEYQWSTSGHTALQVPVYSYGPSAEIFSGMYDNTKIASKMFSLWGKLID